MLIFSVPPKALLLSLTMGLGGLCVGGASGGWIMPIGIAWFGRHDWAALTQIPRVWGIIPMVPSWYTHAEHKLWNVGAIPALIGAAAGMIAAEKLWKYLVVVKYKWMTTRDVEEFLKRGGDG